MRNINMKKQLLLSTLISSLMLSACSSKEPESVQKYLDDEKTVAYLKFKRIPLDDDKKVTNAIAGYVERSALAKAIEESEKLDMLAMEVEVEEFRKQMLISRYFEQFVNEKVTPDAVQNYYNVNAEEFQQKKIRVAHILLRTNGRMTDDEKNARLLKAKEAYMKIEQKVPFEELVEEYSEDKLSVSKQGDLGWLAQNAVDPVFSKKVFSMGPGEISEPFVTNYGYHIVKILEGPKVIKEPFDKVKGKIKYKLSQQAKQAEMQRLQGDS